ncbi:Uma2 family endonuclease [Streptomyces nodosus]|uniref:Restriction endonuclease n=1 Tax=Streptomyces nodosus TaxID=40318 RepID=A0A0B5DM02_9ACTN|nr:Uma2 family endonuclease [Streptomyces nodosus]AJE42175.1 restriction endonuclease [Streptomyces nodosus]MBB4793445.1 Uma2 family endonuclease [Streptomyces nodosus]QEV40696.1 Uma2 family endonuclease [Streptomyces nodosus]
MSALIISHNADQGWEGLVRFREETDWPEGSRVEIIEGIITVAPPPSEKHNDTTELLHERLYGALPPNCDWGVYRTLGLTCPETGSLFVPDLCVVPRAFLRRGTRVHVGDAELVVEVTSRRDAHHDRIKKAHGCAAGGVPFYLLLDPWHSGRPTATLYGEPQNGTYRVLASVEYGDELKLPEPFKLILDTGIFPASEV